VGDKEEPSSKRGHGDACASAGGVRTATLASRPLREGRAPAGSRIAGVRKFCRISFHTGVQHVSRGDYRSCPGSHTVRLGHARAVNG